MAASRSVEGDEAAARAELLATPLRGIWQVAELWSGTIADDGAWQPGTLIDTLTP